MARIITVRSVIAAFLALMVLNVFSAQAGVDPKQEICAEPVNGCFANMNYLDCNAWHGCFWDITRKKLKCIFDQRCRAGKPQLTSSPSKAPTIQCRWPSAGCGSISKNECGSYNGCLVSGQSCVDGGCQETRAPTKAPTICIDVPPGAVGCSSKSDLRSCEQWTCCTWMDAKATCAFTPATPAPVVTGAPSKSPPPPCSTLSSRQCKQAKSRCRVVGNACLDLSWG